MNNREMKEELVNIGWKVHKDETGDVSFELILEDESDDIMIFMKGGKILSFSPDIISLTKQKKLTATCSISTIEFTDTVNRISLASKKYPDLNKSNHEPLIVNWEEIKHVYKTEIILEDIYQLSQNIIEWGKWQSIYRALQCYRFVKGETGQWQLFHLASLAMSGDVDILEKYQTNFVQGNYIDFVPMIDKSVIDKAVEVGLEKKK